MKKEKATKRKKKVKQVIKRTAEEIKQQQVETQKKQAIIRRRLPFIEFPSDTEKSQLLNSLTLLQLKGLNKDAGKSTTGTKKELVARLLQFGVATSPYAKSAVRSSPRKPNTPKIPDCYPKHVVAVLLKVIGLSPKFVDDLNPCFKASLSRRIFSLLRTEDFMDVLYKFVCPHPACQCQIQYTKLDFLAQNYNLYLECRNNHRVFVSGICCMNPVPHCLSDKNDTCVYKHVDQQWLYGYCTGNDNKAKILCLKCKAPKYVCMSLTSKSHVQNCEELVKLKSIQPYNRKVKQKQKKKTAAATLLKLKGGGQEGKVGSTNDSSVKLFKTSGDINPRTQDTATNTSFSPPFSFSKSKCHESISNDSKASRRIGKKSKLSHGIKIKRSRAMSRNFESAIFSSPISLTSTSSDNYNNFFSDDQSNASMEYFANSTSSSMDSGGGSIDELNAFIRKNSSGRRGKSSPNPLNKMDLLLPEDDMYVHNEKSSSVDESYFDFQNAFSPVEEARDRIGFTVDEIDAQNNTSQASIQDLDLRLNDTSESDTSTDLRPSASLLYSIEHFM